MSNILSSGRCSEGEKIQVIHVASHNSMVKNQAVSQYDKTEEQIRHKSNSHLNHRFTCSLRDESHPYLGSIAPSAEGAKTCRITSKLQKENPGASIMI